MKTTAQRIGSNVRAEMARAGVTQVQLAGLIGMSQSMLSARLAGKTAFDVDELARAAGVLGIDAATLMTDPSATSAQVAS